MDEIIDTIEHKASYRYIFRLRPVIIWAVFILIAIIFRIQKWPGALITIVISYSGLLAYLFYSLIKTYPSKNAIYLITKITLMLIGYIILSFLVFRSMYIHPFGGFVVSIIVYMSYTIFYIIQNKIRFKRFTKRNRTIQIN